MASMKRVAALLLLLAACAAPAADSGLESGFVRIFDGKTPAVSFGGPAELRKGVDLSTWTDYRVVAQGPSMRTEINGKVMCELVDRERGKAASEGVLAMPVIPEPMKVQFKDIRLKILP